MLALPPSPPEPRAPGRKDRPVARHLYSMAPASWKWRITAASVLRIEIATGPSSIRVVDAGIVRFHVGPQREAVL
jgi:hypothetical protein